MFQKASASRARLDRHSRVTRLLSVMSATWCVASILAVGVYVNTIWVQELIWVAHLVRRAPTETAELIVHSLVLAVCVICSPLAGIAFGRFLVRAMPPSATGVVLHDRRSLATQVIVITAAVQPYLIQWVILRSLMAEDEYHRVIMGALAGVGLILTAPSLIAWLIGASVPLMLRHGFPNRLLEQPFVLFLRRFSTFSDRAVNALVLRETPAGIPVVELTATRSGAGDWNPFLVGFAGLKLRHPFRSVPIMLRVPDNEWRAAAERLIHRATIVVIDVSDPSDAIASEIEMIGDARRWSATICLRLDGGPTPNAMTAQTAGARVIAYSKNWRRAVPRLFLGAALNLYSAGLWSNLLAWAMLVAALPSIDVDAQGSYIEMTLVAYVIAALIIVAMAFRAVFVLPTLDSRARRALRSALRDAKLATMIEAPQVPAAK